MEGLEVAGHRQAYQVMLPANHFIMNCVLLTLDINFKSSLCTLYRGELLHITCISYYLANCHIAL